MSLFAALEPEKERYVIWDSMRQRNMRGINDPPTGPPGKMIDAAEAERLNEHFRRSLCPHLQYVKADTVEARRYVIKR